MCLTCGLRNLGYLIATEVLYTSLLEEKPKTTREEFVNRMFMNSVHRVVQEIEMASVIENHVRQLQAQVERETKRKLN